MPYRDARADVLIVGAGPTGSVLAIDLLRRGLSVRIIERNAGALPGSRAKDLQPKTLEALADLGAIGPILAVGEPYPPMGVHVGPLILRRPTRKLRKPSADIPFPNTLLIPQFATDWVLYERIAALGGTIDFNATLKAFVREDGGVRVAIDIPNGARQLTCRYLVGADGAGSAVRARLNIDFPGGTDESDRMIIVDARTDGLSRYVQHAWPGPKGRLTLACPLPHTDLFQWTIPLSLGESPDLSEAGLNARIGSLAKGLRLHDVQWTSVFRSNRRLAGRYRDGRVFLAGDAAHVHPSAGALGLNAGIQDAYNLGWKLGQVLHGAPPGLLDTYEAERRPAAAAVLGLPARAYQTVTKVDPRGARGDGDAQQQLRISYRAGPLGRRMAGTCTLTAGDRAPDAILTAGGAKVRLFDHFRGPHFTAIAYGADASAALAALPWPSRGAQLNRINVNAGPGWAGAPGHADPGGGFARTYGLEGDAIVLVRPDGHIAHVGLPGTWTALQAATAGMMPPLD